MGEERKKVAIITGGSRGIGAATVELFVRRGYRVAFTYKNSVDRAQELCSALNGVGELNVIALQCDIRDSDAIRGAVDKVISVYGSIDVLVNNAGVAMDKLFIDTEQSDWREVMKANLDGVYAMTRACLPYMLSQGGSIVNVSSVWGVYGGSGEVAYSASKAGLIGLTKALAQEVGYNGVRVNCVAPGVIDTDMNAAYGSEIIRSLAENTPLGRIGRPDEVAEVIEFLAGDRASFITGEAIEVTGGFKG